MTSQSVVALYNTLADANAAIRDLEAAGVPSSDLEVRASNAGASETAVASAGEVHHGFFDWIFGTDAPEHESHVYETGLAGGGAAVAVHLTDDGMEHTVYEILQRYHPIDIDERIDAVRSSAMPATGMATSATSSYAPPAMPKVQAGSTEEEIAIPIVVEELAVGKREVESGRIRVRTYTREIPVEESVDLRSQWVAVERRPAAYGTAIGVEAFQDKTIDLVETAEEAVVAKTARVTDEVVIRRGTEQRTETVRDTVRKTEVDVDREVVSTADKA